MADARWTIDDDGDPTHDPDDGEASYIATWGQRVTPEAHAALVACIRDAALLRQVRERMTNAAADSSMDLGGVYRLMVEIYDLLASPVPGDPDKASDGTHLDGPCGDERCVFRATERYLPGGELVAGDPDKGDA